MRLAVMRLVVVLASVAMVGSACAADDAVTETAAPEASADASGADGHAHGAEGHGDDDHHGVADMGEPDNGDAATGDVDILVEADMVVEIVMTDFAFSMDDDLVVPVGSTVRFDFVNDGAIEHEAMFGDAHQQQEFAELGDHSDDHGGVGGHHGEVNAVRLDPGASGSLTITFDEAGEMMIGCHLPGHWDAGMHAAFDVA